jgi:methyl-accepting chemotaxis protein
MFGTLQRQLAASLALRWVVCVIAAATFGIGSLLMVTQAEMKYQVEAQAGTVQALAGERLAEQTDAKISLVQERLNGLFIGLENSLRAIAGLRSTQSAARSRNDVWIAEEVGKKLLQVGFSGAIIVDEEMRVIGADHVGASLLYANESLQIHELRSVLRGLAGGRERRDARMYRYSGVIDPALGAILLTSGDGRYGHVLATPVFDDFGETIAVIIAFRVVKMRESAFEDFARITGSNVALMIGQRVISMTGGRLEELHLTARNDLGMQPVPEMKAVARCRNEPSPLTICVMEPEGEASHLSNQIMAIGRQQFERTRTTLMTIGILSLFVMLLVLILLGRRLVRPLAEIASSVGRVAQGEWKVEVPHAERHDEIGRIARALVQMQLSLAERDRMRVEMTRINAINSRRLVMDTAVGRFEDRMAVVMKGISETVRALGSTNAVLDEAARRAETEAERICEASLATASKTSTVSMTTELLRSTIRSLGERVRKTTKDVHRSETHAQLAEAQLDAAHSATQGVEDAIGVLQELVADLGNLSLRASLEAMEAGEAGSRFAPLARSVSELSAKAAASTQMIGSEVQRLVLITDNAGEAIGEVREVLGDALRETSEIAVAISEQDAATLEIAEGMANSSSALLGLAEAVEQLRFNISSAQEASGEFVASARRMAEDARAIDGSVRSFVQEVVA